MERYTRQQLIQEQDREYEEALAEDQRVDRLRALERESIEQRRQRLATPFQKREDVQDTCFSWTVDMVLEWLARVSLNALKDVFLSNEIDGPALVNLSKEDIREEVKIASLPLRKKLWEELEKLRFEMEIVDLKLSARIARGEVEALSTGKAGDLELALRAQLQELEVLGSTIEDSEVALAIDKKGGECLQDHRVAREIKRQFREVREMEREDEVLARQMAGLPIREASDQSEEEEEDVDVVPSSIGKEEEVDAVPSIGKGEEDSDLPLVLEGCLACTESVPCLELACGHFFCKECLAALFLKASSDLTVMPPSCCQVEIDPRIAFKLLNEEDQQKFWQSYTEETSTNKMYCPNPRCSQFINLELLDNSENIQCPRCDTSLCVACKDHSHTTSCEQHRLQTRAQDEQLNNLANQQGWKRCAQCHRMVELYQGCHHMTCLCKYEFCYSCGEKWKTCDCTLWEERRLIADVEQRAPNNLPLQNIIMERLRNAECVHHWERRNSWGGGCQNCGFYMHHYHYGCNDCRRSVCHTCRFHRIVR